MIDLKELDLDILIHAASTAMIKDGLSRSILNFGGWALDDNKMPIVYQVQTLVQEVGGSETRKDVHYYFIPTSQPDQALAIAKALATHDFLDIPYPLMSDRAPMTPSKTPETVHENSNKEDDNNEESNESNSSPESHSEESSKKEVKKNRKPKAKKEEVVLTIVEEVKVAVDHKCDPYDSAKTEHKDAFLLYLDQSHPNWRQAGKEKTKAMSASLVGQPFLTESGQVCESFKSHVKSFLE